jgi:hypothetical protein
MVGAWWFNLVVVSGARSGHPTHFILPTMLALVAVSMGYIGWRHSISGSIVVASILIGMSGILFWVPGLRTQTGWIAGGALLLGMAGVGILLEKRLGQGWQFTNFQALGLILVSMTILALVTLPTLWATHSEANFTLAWLPESIRFRNGMLALKGAVPFLNNLFIMWR